MKLRSLLLAASAVALTATSANALIINGPAQNSGDVLALELDLTADAVEGLYGFNIQRDGAPALFPDGSIRVTITLPAGRVFGADADMTSVVSSGSAAGVNGTFISGGAAGMGGDIVFDLVLPDNQNTITISDLPVDAVATTTDADEFTVSVTSGGSEVDGTPAVDTDNGTIFVPSVAAIEGITLSSITDRTIVEGADDADADDNDGFNALNASGVVGSVEIDEASPLPNVALLTAGAVSPVPFDSSAHVGGTTTVISFPSGTAGIADIDISAGDTSTVGAGSVTVVATDGAAAAGAPVTIDIVGLDDNEAASIVAQIPTLDSVTVDLDAAGFSFTDPDAFTVEAPASSDLGFISRAGTAAERFDWVGETGTLSFFRVTGLPAGTVTYLATFENSQGDKNGTFAGSGTTVGGQLLISSRDLSTINPGFKTADVTFSFDGVVNVGAPGGVDIDRQLFRNNVVSDFGQDSGSAQEIINRAP